MKILLVKPYNISDHIQPSLGLGYVASAVRDDNDVRIIDCIKERLDILGLERIIKETNPDVVGLQCYTFDIKFVSEAIKMIKHINKAIVTVIGGPHCSAVPKESMDYFGEALDYAFVGEAEIGFKKLIDCLKDGKEDFSEIHGLVYRQGSNIKINPSYFEEDLDSFRMVAWDLIRPNEYPESQHGAFYKKFPIAPIISTRGCPYNCTFCAGKIVSGRKLRKRSIKNIIDEIVYLYNKFGIREFHIIDDNFTLDKQFVLSFLEELERKHLDISWALPNGIRMENLSLDLLKKMKHSGLYLVSLGIESGTDRVLKLMRKNLTVETTRKTVKLIREAGLEVAGFFIIGTDGETLDEMKETIRFSLELDLIRANYFTYLPFPGTESYNNLKNNGKISNVNWDRFYFNKAPYSPDGITHKQLRQLQRKAFLQFHLRPIILLKNLSQVQSFKHFKFLLSRFNNWIIK